MPAEISIEGHGGRLVIVVLCYENVLATHTADANWLRCEVRVRMGGWEGAVRVSLTTEDFVLFCQDLQHVLEGTATTATFDTMEEVLALRVEETRTGICRITGTVRDRSSPQIEFLFVLDSDQSYLRSALVGLQQVVATFPVRGTAAP